MPSFFRTFAYSGATLALALMVGCSTGDSVDPQPTDEISEAPAETSPAPSGPERIRLRANGGEEVLVLRIKENEATLESGAESFDLITNADQSVQVEDAAGAALALVTTGDEQWVVGNANQPEESYVLRRFSDGNYQFETADGEAVYGIQERAYGFEITAPDETSLYQLRLKDERLVLRSAENQTVMVTRDALVPAAMLPFAFDVLSSEQQVGLAYAIHQSGS